MKKTLTLLAVAIVLGLSSPGPALSGSSADLPGTVRQETLKHGGMDRTFLAFIPTDLPEKPPLILVLHGALGTGSAMRSTCDFGFDRLAVREKCVVVYPDGYCKHWNDCRTTPGDAAHKKNIDDVGFIGAVIDACREKWGVDTARVYVVGLSNGGSMCFRLAQEIPEKIAGIGPIGAAMPTPEETKCATAPKPGMPVAMINGTDDPICPFEGGMVQILHIFKKGMALSSQDSARQWLRPESRDKQPVVEKLPDLDPEDGTTIERLTWPGEEAALYVVRGGGHTVPGGTQFLPSFIVGPVSRDMDAAAELWKFFQEHPKGK